MRATRRRMSEVRMIILRVESEFLVKASAGRQSVLSTQWLTLQCYFLINAALLFGVAHLLQTPHRVMAYGPLQGHLSLFNV